MIGVIGGTGDIGSKVVTLLLEQTNCRIKIGSRHIYRKHELLESYNRIEYHQVYCEDTSSLHKFMKDCEVVVNCVGPSHFITPHFLDEAEFSGVHCVDLGTIKTDRCRKSLNTVSIHSAGTAQGLSGILQRIAIDGIKKVDTFEYSFGGISAFTRSAAMDFLRGISQRGNKPMTAYSNGKVISTGIENIRHEGYFDDSVVFYPFFDEESEYLVQHCEIDKGRWCFAVEGTYFNRQIKKLRYEALLDKNDAVEKVYQASKMDQEIRGEVIKFWVRSDYKQGELSKSRMVKLRAKEQSYLSALTVLQVVKGILQKHFKVGRYPLVEINDPMFIYKGVSKDASVSCEVSETLEDEYGFL